MNIRILENNKRQIRTADLEGQKNRFGRQNNDFTKVSQQKGGISVAIKVQNQEDKSYGHSSQKPLSAYSTNWSKSGKHSTGGCSKDSLGDDKNSGRQALHKTDLHVEKPATQIQTSQRSDHSKQSDGLTSSPGPSGRVMQMPASYQKYQKHNTKTNPAPSIFGTSLTIPDKLADQNNAKSPTEPDPNKPKPPSGNGWMQRLRNKIL